MKTERFAGSRVKLHRAGRFIAELDKMLIAHDATVLEQPKFDFSRDPPAVLLEFNGLPLEAGAILGDAVHNMRTALDLMASELARLNGQNDNKVYFPFSAAPEDLDSQIKSKNFARAGTDAVALLLTLRPYKGGNERLRAIHDLDIHDKHRALLETVRQMSFELSGHYDVTDPSDNSLTLTNASVVHFFGQDSVLTGLPLIKTLKELVELVEGILKAFDDLLAGRARPGPL